LFNNYLQKNEILIRKDILPFLLEVDTIVFDIDGVLVDVSASYYQTIIDTVQYYFSSIMNMPGKDKLLDKQMIDSFKMVGGFNDDWELTAAAVLYYLWKMKEQQIVSIKELKNNSPVISEFINKNLSGGGGLTQFITWIRENTYNPEDIFILWDKEKIFQIAKELYSGGKYCFRLYGFSPGIIDNIDGNVEQEVLSIKPRIEKMLKKYNIGILTGRNRAETDFLIERIKWKSWLQPERVVTAEDGLKKPSPAGLRYLMNKFQSEVALFIGDTMDDLLTVKNLNSQNDSINCLSALVLGQDFKKGVKYKEHYLKNNVDILAEDVNQVINLLENSRLNNFNSK